VPTRVTREFALRLTGNAFTYTHKGFTPAAFRGRRLHALGMGHALGVVCAEGSQGLVAVVDAANADSLRSTARLGFESCGRGCLLGTLRPLLHVGGTRLAPPGHGVDGHGERECPPAGIATRSAPVHDSSST
jgi:hypothetical protein